jgi:hypothetical protein
MLLCESHSCLREESDNLDLPADGLEKEIKLRNISPLPKPRYIAVIKLERKGGTWFSIYGSTLK